jgi:hypothetical protein
MFWLAASAHAALQWEALRLETTAKGGEEKVTTAFRFKNGGTAPVTIVSAQPSCGCTEVEIPKRSFAPGESGELKARFSTRDRMGMQETQIIVGTDTAGDPPTTLTLKVIIPEVVRCDRRLVTWEAANATAEQSILVSIVDPSPAKALQATAASSAVAVRVETVEAGRRYRIHLKLADPTLKGVVAVNCTAELEGALPYAFVVYALEK